MTPALPQLLRLAQKLPHGRARAVVAALIGRAAIEPIDTMAEAKRQAAATFARDMQPVCDAVAEALHAEDKEALEAMRGLRALLPELRKAVVAGSTLEDLLALQLGRTVLRSMSAAPGEDGQ